MAFGRSKKVDSSADSFKMGVGNPKASAKAAEKRNRKAINELAAEKAEAVADEQRDSSDGGGSEKRDAKRHAGKERTAHIGSNGRAKKRRRHPRDTHNITLIVILVCILTFSVFMFYPPATKITQGLDIQGGLSVIMTATHTDNSTVTSDEMDQAVSIITARVNKLGASEATVQLDGTDSILIQIPGVEDAQTALSTIGATGTLEFVDLNDITDQSEITAIENGQTGQTLDPSTYTAFMTGKSITKVSVGQESKGSAYYAVNLTLDADGTKAFSDTSTALYQTKGQIAILLDGVVQSAPQVDSAITSGQVAITGKYTLDSAKNLQTILESGALPVTLTMSQSQTVGPTLGQQSLSAGLLAAGLGMLVVMIYLLFFYEGLGVLTAVNMGVFAALYLGILAVLSYFGLFALSLSGLAGIVLTIGMAADSSILVLERFREEIRMGRSVKAASITGVKHGIGTSIDADVVTFVSAIVLFAIAVGSVKGFGLTLALGIVCDIITMLLFKAPAIRLLAPGLMAHHPGFWGIKGDQQEGKRTAADSGARTAPKDHNEKGGGANA